MIDITQGAVTTRPYHPQMAENFSFIWHSHVERIRGMKLV
jgi:hypothetical protein